MKNSADLGGCYPPRPSAMVDNTLPDLQNCSYPTQPHSLGKGESWEKSCWKSFYTGKNDYLMKAKALDFRPQLFKRWIALSNA